MQLICIMSHQAKLIEVRKQPPGVDIGQAAPHLQVCECRQKHLKDTKKLREDAPAIFCAGLTFIIHSVKNEKHEETWT